MKLPFLQKKHILSVSASSTDAFQAVRFGVLLVVSIIMALMFVFLYRDFYQTIVRAREVIVLKQEVALEDINRQLFDRVVATHNYKITPVINNTMSDPFDTQPIPPPQPPAPEVTADTP